MRELQQKCGASRFHKTGGRLALATVWLTYYFWRGRSSLEENQWVHYPPHLK